MVTARRRQGSRRHDPQTLDFRGDPTDRSSVALIAGCGKAEATTTSGDLFALLSKALDKQPGKKISAWTSGGF
jgi:hypothetical protein